MDTNRIKKFATEARNKLKAGIAAKIITLGFDKNGNVPEHMRPQLMQGGSLWNGQLQTEGFYYQWTALYNRVQQKGIKEVYEEAAYTWFNRLVAIRILQKTPSLSQFWLTLMQHEPQESWMKPVWGAFLRCRNANGNC